MKLQAVHHFKTKKLKVRLGIPLWQACGILELIWQFTTEYADDGDLSNFSAEEIAAWMEYEGDAADMIQALIDAGYLDRPDEGGLRVHDWDDHAPRFVKRRTQRQHPRSPEAAMDTDGRPREDTGAHGRPVDTDGRPVVPSGDKKPATPEPEPEPLPEGERKKDTNTAIMDSDGPDIGRTPAATLPPGSFDRWWAIYPRKVKKARAREAFVRSVRRYWTPKDMTLADAVDKFIAITERFVRTPAARGEYCPHPTSWLNQDRWDDDPADWQLGGDNKRVDHASTASASEAGRLNF